MYKHEVTLKQVMPSTFYGEKKTVVLFVIVTTKTQICHFYTTAQHADVLQLLA